MIEIEWTSGDEAEVFDGPDYLGFVWWTDGEWVARSADDDVECGGFDDEMQAAQWLASSEW